MYIFTFFFLFGFMWYLRSKNIFISLQTFWQGCVCHLSQYFGVQSVIFLSRLQGLHSWRSLKILSLISFTPTYVCKNSYKWSIVGPTFYFAMVIYVIHPNTIFPSFICEWIQKNTHWWPGWRALFKNRDIIQKI